MPSELTRARELRPLSFDRGNPTPPAEHQGLERIPQFRVAGERHRPSRSGGHWWGFQRHDQFSGQGHDHTHCWRNLWPTRLFFLNFSDQRINLRLWQLHQFLDFVHRGRHGSLLHGRQTTIRAARQTWA